MKQNLVKHEQTSFFGNFQEVEVIMILRASVDGVIDEPGGAIRVGLRLAHATTSLLVPEL